MEHFVSLCGVISDYMPNIQLPNTAELLGIYGRICVNSFNILDPDMNTLGVGVYLGPSILDHSCKPNDSLDESAAGGDEEGRAVLHLRACKDVQKGEELFIRYTGDEEDDLNQRRYALMHWLGRDCQCEKCVGEEMEREVRQLEVG